MNNRRFLGTSKLYEQAFCDIASAHVYVIGVGGVGSWVAEGLARTAIGEITLVDLDVLVESNINRQLPALSSTLGESKIAAMEYRLKQINPDIKVNLIDDFLAAQNVASILPSREQVRQQNKNIVVLDCVDDMDAKLAIALHCRFNKIKLLISGAAGGKINPLNIKVNDLKDVSQDALLAKLRSKLRAKGINQQMKEKFGLKCVYSTEQAKMSKSCQSGLSCGGYGSAVVVTSTIGMVMVSECLAIIANDKKAT